MVRNVILPLATLLKLILANITVIITSFFNHNFKRKKNKSLYIYILYYKFIIIFFLYKK